MHPFRYKALYKFFNIPIFHSSETEKYRQRYENRRSQQNEDYERVRAGFENREADLNEALKAKDSQLAVLRVRIQETDAELQGKTKALEETQVQNERFDNDTLGFY